MLDTVHIYFFSSETHRGTDHRDVASCIVPIFTPSILIIIIIIDDDDDDIFVRVEIALRMATDRTQKKKRKTKYMKHGAHTNENFSIIHFFPVLSRRSSRARIFIQEDTYRTARMNRFANTYACVCVFFFFFFFLLRNRLVARISIKEDVEFRISI